MENETEKEPKRIKTRRFVLLSLAHISVGIAIVVINSFLNSELTFSGWSEDIISIYLGIPILFELFRLLFGYLYDRKGILKGSLIFSLILSSSSIFFIPYFIFPVGNLWIILTVSGFYAGSAGITTLLDSHMTAISSSDNRSMVAGIIQITRLSGFAIGGFIGSLLYIELEFRLFITVVTLFYTFLALFSILSVKPNSYEKQDDFETTFSLKELINVIFSQLPILMILFLVIYPIGLFMQDLILEPFAINVLNFEKENVGQVVAIWTGLTLIFVPLGILLEKKLNRRIPIFVGQILSAIGLTLIAITYLYQSIMIFYLGLVNFGIGNGIASVPAISIMLDVAAVHEKFMSILLGLFGMMITVGRFLGAIFGGLILRFTGTNYLYLFMIETFFVILSLVPILILIKLIRPDLKELNNERQNTNKDKIVNFPDLN